MKAGLAKYDALIDLLVDLLVREYENAQGNEKPAEPWQANRRGRDGDHGNQAFVLTGYSGLVRGARRCEMG